MTNLFLKLLNMSITAGWLVLVILLLRIFLQNVPKWLFPALWSLVGIRLLLPQSLESRLSLVPDVSRTGVTMQTVLSGGTHQPIVILSYVWCAGMILMVLYGIASYLRLRYALKTAVHLSENIYQSEYAKSAFIVGVFAPRIYLPFHIDEQDIDSVLAHERTHIKRRDHWRKPIAFLLLSVYWFHPLIWVAYTLLCKDIELACDARVIEDMDDSQRVAYSQALLSCTATRHTIAACPVAFGSRDVKKRIRLVLSYRKPAKYAIGAAIVVFLVLSVCFLTNPKHTGTDTLSVEYDQGIVASDVLSMDAANAETSASDTATLSQQRLEDQIPLITHVAEDLEQSLYDSAIQQIAEDTLSKIWKTHFLNVSGIQSQK